MMPLSYRLKPHWSTSPRWRELLITSTALFWTLGASHAAGEVSQTPLLLGGGNVPGNLALVPSVEFPTVISLANLGNYNNSISYTGYFDSNKCYSFVEQAFTHPFFGEISVDDGGGYFTPVSETSSTSRNCSTSTGKWSGNYLNWATTQTIDPFRKALTGGYRVVDTTSQTILKKPRAQTETIIFPTEPYPAPTLQKPLHLEALKSLALFTMAVATKRTRQSASATLPTEAILANTIRSG